MHQIDKNGVHGKIHVFAREWIRGLPTEPLSESVQVEAMIRVQEHSFNLTREFGNDGYLNKLAALVTQFRSREENEIPAEAGFCFDGGFITEPLEVEQSTGNSQPGTSRFQSDGRPSAGTLGQDAVLVACAPGCSCQTGRACTRGSRHAG